MPRFFFHLANGSGFVEDEEGAELETLEAARQQALTAIRDIMATELKRGDISLGSVIEIEDEKRQQLMTIPFSDAVKITTERPQQHGGNAAKGVGDENG